MISTTEQSKNIPAPAQPVRVKRYVGEVVYIYAFDVAYEMSRHPVHELLEIGRAHV